jgi:hypothetical protein
MIPNDAGSLDDVGEFLLTPIAGGCIHVPPPPPNYVVHVAMTGGQKAKIGFGAIEVIGTLTLPEEEQSRNYYSFELKGEKVKDFDVSNYIRY